MPKREKKNYLHYVFTRVFLLGSLFSYSCFLIGDGFVAAVTNDTFLVSPPKAPTYKCCSVLLMKVMHDSLIA